LFENIIAQPATDQMQADFLSNKLAPSLLLFGPQASGKGSSAIELARALTCEKTVPVNAVDNGAAARNSNAAPWGCDCSSCTRNRSLTHPALAMIGPRSFAAEIAATRAAFLRDPSSIPGRLLFVRSLQKLLARFSPSVWEYESRSGKINPLPLIQSLEEEIDEIESPAAAEKHTVIEKLAASLVNNAFKLEDEWISEGIPIAQVRKASSWSHLSPAGKRKILIIENADRMQEPAANTLLKLLEEPPGSITIILTAQRRESLLPTIQSRLRPYRFVTRSIDKEREIIRRVFRDSSHLAESVSAYLDSFLPQPSEKLINLSAFFIAAVARAVNSQSALSDKSLSPAIKALDSYCTLIADAAGFGRVTEAKEVLAVLLSSSGNFEGRSFPRFLALLLDLVSRSFAECRQSPVFVTCREIWNKRIGETQAAFSVWNQKPDLALESLFYRLKEDMVS